MGESTEIPTITNMEYPERRIQIEAKKLVKLLVGNNITFDWKKSLSKGIISNDRLGKNMETINGKYGDIYFEMN